MANDSTISGLPAVTIPTSSDELPLDQTSGGNTVTKRLTLGRINGYGARVTDYMSAAQIADAQDLTPTIDCTAAIQAALDTGKDVDLCGLALLCVGLTQSTDFQTIFSSSGIARLIKNGNGVILTSSGDNVTIIDVGFRGDAASPTYTGNNVNASGANFSLINCGSRWAEGRAVLSTGGHTQIHGTCDIYQTADATATGYDIELGVSGTATLYHQIVDVYTSHATGGIKLIDTGSAVIIGGQIGKLTIAAGTSPAGVNGGSTLGSRILGDVSVGLSNAVFSGNQFGAGAITFGVGTAGCSMDASNSYQTGHTITNNGNANNFICRNVSTGSTIDLQFGDDSSICIVKFTPGGAANANVDFPNTVSWPNNVNVYGKNTSGGVGVRLAINASDNATVGNSVSAKDMAVSQTGDGTVTLATNSTQRLRVSSTGVQAVTGAGALATNATTGFLYVPVCAGTPTGVPTAVTGAVPVIVDSTNHKLYFYSGGSWRDAGP